MKSVKAKQGNGGMAIDAIPLARLSPNPSQPRQHWDEEKDNEGKTSLQRLAESIRTEGILQPLVVTPQNGSFLIVCGDRRFRAAKIAGLKEVPCVVRQGLSQEQILEMGLIENLQREDLTAIDEAHAFKALMDKCHYTQATIAKRLGLSVAAVNYKLSLLKLSPELQKEVKKGNLSETQGRTIAQAVNKLPASEEKKGEAMEEIKEKVTKVRETNGGKVDSKQVATIAKTVVEKRAKETAQPCKAKATEKVQPPTAKEKKQAKAFAKALAISGKAFRPFAELVNSNGSRARFASVIVATQQEASDMLKGLDTFLGRIIDEVAEVKRQHMVAKLSK